MSNKKNELKYVIKPVSSGILLFYPFQKKRKNSQPPCVSVSYVNPFYYRVLAITECWHKGQTLGVFAYQ